jgi:branched-chain amino acid transport system ATP-binding protein
MAEPLRNSIEIDGVTVSFGGLKALDGAALTFEAGRINGLIGPNGSGKSTLVNLVSGQVAAAAGHVRFGARTITNLRPDQIASLGLARTFQIPKFPPELSIEDIIGVPMIYLRGRERLIPELTSPAGIASFCGIRKPLSTLCGSLSVPDLRRLEIARALACAPAVLLLDEVMAGLSLEDCVQVVNLVRRINAVGITIVIIEHIMRIIVDVCDRVVVLNNGTVLCTGAPRVVLADPAVREAYLGPGFTHE